MNDKKIKKIALSLTADRNNYMSAFRKNIFTFMESKEFTLSELAEKADIPFSTLRTFLYGETTDCKLSTAVKIAHAFGISIDELVGAETIEQETRETIAMARTLKDHHRYVIRTFARHQYNLHSDVPKSSKQISVLLPDCQNGYLKTTNVTEALNIDHLSDGTKSKASLGLRIPCDHYEPFFMKNEILLLAVDRAGNHGEKCVIIHGGNLYICIKHIDRNTKEVKYLSLIDGKNVMFTSEEIEDRMGYVIGFLNPDGTYGIR